MNLINNLKSVKRFFGTSIWDIFCLFILHSSLLILGIHPFGANCFSQWQQVATINTTELRGVKFFNAWTGIAVGAGGIWRSTNSGMNWTQVLSGVNMNSVSFPDINTGYAVGDSGKIYKTTDNGLNWTSQVSGVSNNLYGVAFYNINAGQSLGQNGKILRTGNGGLTWNSQYNQLSEDLYSVVMTSYFDAHAVGGVNNELFLTTGNGGTNWSYLLSVGGNYLRSLAVLSGTPTTIVVGGNGVIRRSTSMGQGWTLIPSGTTAQLNNIVFIDNSTGFIAGNNGFIFRSTNGGINWAQQPFVTSYNLKAISLINSTTGWIVGQNGIVLRTGIPVTILPISSGIPSQFKLYQNYPNPFNGQTKIMFDLPINGKFNLSIISVDGKVQDLISNQYLPAGRFYYNWNPIKYSSGIYFFRAVFGNKIKSIKVLLLK